jgi:hypothetical protein
VRFVEQLRPRAEPRRLPLGSNVEYMQPPRAACAPPRGKPRLLQAVVGAQLSLVRRGGQKGEQRVTKAGQKSGGQTAVVKQVLVKHPVTRSNSPPPSVKAVKRTPL